MLFKPKMCGLEFLRITEQNCKSARIVEGFLLNFAPSPFYYRADKNCKRAQALENLLRIGEGSTFGVRAYCVTHWQSSKPFMHTMLSKKQHVFMQQQKSE